MKKIIALAVTMAAAVTMATAEITVGARGIFGLGLGTTVSSDFDDLGMEVDLGKSLDFGFAAFVKIPVWEALGVQPELGFTHHQVGLKWDFGIVTLEGTGAINTIDLPVLVTYDIAINDAFSVTPFLGPQLSFPLGKVAMGGDFDGDGDIDSKVLFSIVLGANVSYKVGPGAIVGDLRYNLGLTPLKSDDTDMLTLRALLFSVGYQIQF